MYASKTGNARLILRRTEQDTLKTKDSRYDDLGGWRKGDFFKFQKLLTMPTD